LLKRKSPNTLYLPEDIEYLGIDISKSEISFAKKKVNSSTISFLATDAVSFEFPMNSYDFVLSHMFIHLIDKPGELFDLIIRSLNHGGSVLAVIRDPEFTDENFTCLMDGVKEFFKTVYPNFDFSSLKSSSHKIIDHIDRTRERYSMSFIEPFVVSSEDPNTFVSLILDMFPCCLVGEEERKSLEKVLYSKVLEKKISAVNAGLALIEVKK